MLYGAAIQCSAAPFDSQCERFPLRAMDQVRATPEIRISLPQIEQIAQIIFRANIESDRSQPLVGVERAIDI